MKLARICLVLASMCISTGSFASNGTSTEARFGELVMTGPESGVIKYEDTCANGGNITDEGRKAFIDAVIANPESRVAKIKKALLAELGEDAEGEGVYINDMGTTFHDRNGCGVSLNSHSYLIATLSEGNSNHYVSKYIMTINDDDDSGVRTLQVLSIVPFTPRNER